MRRLKTGFKICLQKDDILFLIKGEYRNEKSLKKGIALASVMIMSGGVLAACGGGGGSTADTTAATTASGNTTTAASTTASGSSSGSSSSGDKILKIGELWAIDGIDPVSDGTLVKEKALVTEVLVEVNDKFELLPALATKWENKDENTWVFTIKEGVKFHDGTDMDAEAVAWSINNTLEKNPTTQTSTKIAKAEATGANEVTITTAEPNGELPEFMHLSNMGIIAKSSYDSSGNMNIPIGTGPFKIKEFNAATGAFTTERNDDYYGELPEIAGVYMTGMTDANTRAMALESGEVDFTCDLPFNEVDRLDALDNVRVEKYDTARVYNISLNCGDLFSDKNVRTATSLAIDRQTISDKVLSGCGTPSKNIFTENMAWDDTSIDGSTFDLEKAKSLMDEAGWKDTNGDGTRDKDGREFEFTLMTYTERPGLPLIAEAIQSQLKELGMKVNVSTMDWSAMSERQKTGEWGMSMSGSATAMAPSSLYFLNNNYNSEKLAAIGYSNPEFDSLLAEGMKAFDTEERYGISKKIQQLAMDELPILYVCNYGVAYGFNEKVQNFKFNPTAHDYMWNTDIKIED